MRKVLSLIAALALPLSFAACNQNDQAAFISNVQKAAIAACQFLPAAETIAAIFTANATLIPAQVANAICAAVMKPGARLDGTEQAPRVMVGDKSIPIKGMFVSKEFKE